MTTPRDKQDRFKRLIRSLRLRSGQWTGQNLRAALETLDLTQAQLATLAAVNLRTVSRWVNDTTPVPLTVALMVQGLLDKQKHGWK
jgi:plasmid maintenance system antidote protein VapI